MVSVDSVLLVVTLSAGQAARVADSLADVRQEGPKLWGRVCSLRATLTESELVLGGSLPAFLLGTNARGISPFEVACCPGLIASEVDLPVRTLADAYVRRVDVAANLLVPRPVPDYLRALVEVPRMSRNAFTPWSLLFKNGVRQLAFYDKARELERKGQSLPDVWGGRNVLRYEMRLMRQLSERFGGQVFFKDLSDPAFYRGLVTLWRDQFDTVQTHRPFRLVGLTNVPGLRDSLALRGVEAAGGLAAVLDAVNDARATGSIGDGQAIRMRAWARALTSSPALTLDSDLADELRRAVRDAAGALLK